MENKYFRALAAFEEVQNAAAEEEKKMRKHISTLQGKKQAVSVRDKNISVEKNDIVTNFSFTDRIRDGERVERPHY